MTTELNRWAGERELSKALGDLLHETALWALRPQLLPYLKSASMPNRAQAHLLRHVTRGRVGRPLLHLASDGTLFVWTTLNQRRSFGRLVPVEPSSRRHTSAWMSAQFAPRSTEVSLAEEAARRVRPILPVTPSMLMERMARMSAQLVFAGRLLRQDDVSRLVVATQHSAAVRCFIAAARDLAIPSIYIPHAPAADNPQYADLPVDHAWLRGSREMEFYKQAGASPDRMAIVGSAGIPELPATIEASHEIVVAPSTWSRPELEAFFTVIRTSGIGPFVVCPHPGSDVKALQQLAGVGNHVLVGTRTFDRLRAGGVLLQHSSGVALEALLLGLPVIEVSTSGRAPSYPFIQEPQVSFARTPKELRAHVAHHLHPSTAERDARVELAREWCVQTGPDAEAAIGRNLRLGQVAQEPLLDVWSHTDLGG